MGPDIPAAQAFRLTYIVLDEFALGFRLRHCHKGHFTVVGTEITVRQLCRQQAVDITCHFLL